MVEYAVLHPKVKTIQTDSLVQKQKQVNLYAKEPATSELNAEEKNADVHWADYLVLGIRAIGEFFIKLLAHL